MCFGRLFRNKKFTDLENKITTSKKVELALKEQGRNKNWLAEKLGISRPTLYSRLNNNAWEVFEIKKLRDLGLII